MAKVLVFGTFDRLHPGHEFVLKEAAKRGDLFVIVARDANVERIKSKLPRQNEGERLQSVREAAPEAEVRLGDAEDFLAPVRAIQPDLIVLGYDQALPPGIEEHQLGCPIERLEAFAPERYKSSLSDKSEK